MANRVTHFEIHAENPERAIGFYEALFGWKFQQWGDQPYWLVITGSDGECGINGGLLPRRGAAPEEGQAVNAFVCTVEVESVDASLEAALEHGGKLALEKMPIPTVGWLAYVADTEGNLFGIMQPDPQAE
ncbi:MAG: VOC family protein [Acidobacteriota bacterium]